MSDPSKPGFFKRLKNVISTGLNDAVDSVSDPGQELALMLDDLGAQIKQAEKDLHQAMVDRKMMERKIERLAKDEANWQGRAEQALKLGDDTLARAALERRGELAQEKKDAELAHLDQVKLVEDMKVHIKESKQKLKALNLRRGSLMAQARAAKRGDSTGAADTAGTGNRLDAIETKIAELEASNEVASEMRGDRVADAEIEARLRALDTGGGSAVDDELEALKAKLAAKGALTDGKK